ncbi:Csu type fimbrial protein [Dyella acidiphila]|uniref:Spore coat protein U domain-containing protein n=1 Tax=Dyella acidiphila TaxID=2775866 RepID=A0ABR9GDA2_9GAMM|nr:spore coat U domain-containing protein [Dyella acidiphila]MBE1162025.1 spore coat protein U domain-containing protein [Dyella acidiphila]
MKYLVRALLLCLLLLAGGRLHAETCTATASSVNFGNVSPIAGTAVAASGTVSITCTWSTVTLTPSVQVCLNVGATSPRLMSNGTNTLQYDLYQDAAHSLVWGSVYNGTTPIGVQLNKPATGTSATTTVSYYGLIAANQPTVPTVNNSSTVYSQGFGGNQTSLNYGFYVLIAPTCASLTTSNGTFPFTSSATVVNNCLISATNVAFGTAGVLRSSLAATGSISARCTNGDAFRIALNGGVSGNVAARTLQQQGGTGVVSYQLYTDSAHSIPWGDGTAGTSTVTGTGSGNAQAISVYGQVPAQATPAPGSYSDTITATIVF